MEDEEARARSERRRLLLTSLEEIPAQDEYEEEDEQTDENDDHKAESLRQFVSIVKRVQQEKASMEKILDYEDPELLRQLFVSYVVSREKLFSKRKIISGLVDGAFNEAATKDSIFNALHVRSFRLLLLLFSFSIHHCLRTSLCRPSRRRSSALPIGMDSSKCFCHGKIALKNAKG